MLAISDGGRSAFAKGKNIPSAAGRFKNRGALCGTIEPENAPEQLLVSAISARGWTMPFDPVLLTRVQFAQVIARHIIVPAVAIGAVSFIAILEGLALGMGGATYARVPTRPPSFRPRSAWISSRES
jgi:hypothetical protein